MKDPHSVIKYPLATEKSIMLMEKDNKMTFIVDRKANKLDIKEAIEQIFKVKITKVNTAIMPDGEKKAFVKLSPDTPALDVATQLGMI